MRLSLLFLPVTNHTPQGVVHLCRDSGGPARFRLHSHAVASEASGRSNSTPFLRPRPAVDQRLGTFS
jgi:hypothetical protein